MNTRRIVNSIFSLASGLFVYKSDGSLFHGFVIVLMAMFVLSWMDKEYKDK